MRHCLAWLAVLACVGCRPPAPVDPPSLWTEPVTWLNTGGSDWARSVSFSGTRRVTAEEQGTTFQAVAFPTGRSGTLALRSGARSTRLTVTAPVPIAWPLDGDGVLDLTATGVALHRPVVRAARPRAHRVLLIVVDTLRADHVSAERSPELWTYFSSGLRFEQAFASATWTLPSLASIFTGSRPVDLRLEDGTLVSIESSEHTLAAAFRDRGYHTVGHTANYIVKHENGYSSGFELFTAPDERAATDATDIIAAATRSLEWFADDDLFMYLHFMEPHDPYRNHETGESFRGRSSHDPVDALELEGSRRAYRSEVARLSRLVGAFLEASGPFDLVVLTADHGEEFREHGGLRHGPTVYPEASRVPLLIRSSDVRAGVVEHPVAQRHLKDFLLGVDTDLLAADQRVVVEAVGGTPPRFGLAGEPGFSALLAWPVPERPGRELDAWVLANVPAVDVRDAHDRRVAVTPRHAGRVLAELEEYFAGFRRGLFVRVVGEDVDVEIEGATADAWVWGRAATLETAMPRPGTVRVRIERPDPWVLAFAPGDASISVRERDGGRVDVRDARPPVEAGMAAWFDPGRPPAELGRLALPVHALRNAGRLPGPPPAPAGPDP